MLRPYASPGINGAELGQSEQPSTKSVGFEAGRMPHLVECTCELPLRIRNNP